MSELLVLARKVLDGAEPGEQVEVVLGRATSTTVKVYDGAVESLTSAGSSGAGIRVIRDGRQGFAHCGSHDVDVLADTLVEARDNCSFGEPDEFNGLAAPDGVAVVPQESWSDAVVELPNDRKVELALELERRVLGVDPRVTTRSHRRPSATRGASPPSCRPPASRPSNEAHRARCPRSPWPGSVTRRRSGGRTT